MLNQYLIEKLSTDFKIAPLNIIREYLEMEVLYYLSQSILEKNLIFYGGTALRLAYHSFRFSEDLDFLLTKDLPSGKKELNDVLNKVVKDNPKISVEEVFEKRYTLFGLLHVKNELLKHPIRIKIEISKKKNGVESDYLLLTTPFSNKEAIIKTATLEAIYKLKRKSIQERRVMRDWFDFWYLSQKLGRDNIIQEKFPFPVHEFSRELKRYLPRDKWKIIDSVIGFYTK